MRDLFALFVLIGLALIAVFAGAFALDGASCKSSWRDSGFPVRYSAMGGCRISRDGGRPWIPADSLRSIQ